MVLLSIPTTPHSAVHEVKCIFLWPYVFIFFEAFTDTSEILEDVHHYFLPLKFFFLKPQLLSSQSASSLQAEAALTQNISHKNDLKLFISTYNKETFV